MTEAEALDLAAKAAGWLHWDDARQLAERGEIEIIRAHAATLMENAALKAENEALKALREALAVLRDLPIIENDSPNTLHLDGEPHTGPAVDYLFHVVRKIKLVARTALERISS